MKKILCFMSFMLVLCTIVFAGCDKTSTEKAIDTTPNAIGNLSIYTIDKADQGTLPLLFNLGHTFLSFDNTTDDAIVIGNYTVPSHESVCFGTWSISNHFGVWFNVESNYQYKYDRYNGRVSVTKEINLEDLEKINEFISKNDRWTPTKNCSYFALNLWNSIASEKETLKKPVIYTPSHIANELRQFETCKENRDFGNTSQTMVYYSKTQYVSFNMKGEDKYV